MAKHAPAITPPSIGRPGGPGGPVEENDDGCGAGGRSSL